MRERRRRSKNNTPDAPWSASSKRPVSSPSSGPEVTTDFMTQRRQPASVRWLNRPPLLAPAIRGNWIAGLFFCFFGPPRSGNHSPHTSGHFLASGFARRVPFRCDHSARRRPLRYCHVMNIQPASNSGTSQRISVRRSSGFPTLRQYACHGIPSKNGIVEVAESTNAPRLGTCAADARTYSVNGPRVMSSFR